MTAQANTGNPDKQPAPLRGMRARVGRQRRRGYRDQGPLVKGASPVVKLGTKVKNIRLIESHHAIDCRIDRFSA